MGTDCSPSPEQPVICTTTPEMWMGAHRGMYQLDKAVRAPVIATAGIDEAVSPSCALDNGGPMRAGAAQPRYGAAGQLAAGHCAVFRCGEDAVSLHVHGEDATCRGSWDLQRSLRLGGPIGKALYLAQLAWLPSVPCMPGNAGGTMRVHGPTLCLTAARLLAAHQF